MNKFLKSALFSCLLLSLFLSSSAQTCKSFTSFTNNVIYNSCNDLPVLNSFLYWNYDQSNGTVNLAYRHTSVTASNWVSWAINPTGQGMLGSQALVAFQNSSGVVHAYTSQVTQYQTNLPEGSLSFGVTGLSAELVNGDMIIFATLQIPSSMGTTVNQVWQVGPVSGGAPGTHPTSGDNVKSMGTVDFLSGQTTTSGGSGSRIRKRNVHGVLNAVSWGTLMPLGVIIARYLKVFKSADPAWFYLHVACQCSAYVVGVAGWATGIKLGSDSPGTQYDTHRNIGITLFCLGTLQVFALLLRPKKDHKYRLYWSIYHQTIGYTVIILSIVNIYKGFDILGGQKNWKKAYTGILIFLGFNAAMLEAFTWYIVIKRKRDSSEKYPPTMNGANGVNGYGNRTNQVV
ncbi:hypothetical protein L1049_024056 [Liquidambar formosana]|uniref:Cytochrome b561 and DOMON domain-containing protein n=1 Tax=Liquidambar formosana TaxID=63359 RepID=A0AAP0X107_LIQFO